jgi:proteasome lid subunit RPN8/RPN11
VKTEAVTIPRDTLAAIVAYASDARPEECCGLLIGHGIAVTTAVAVPNVAATRETRYELDPAAYIRTRREARTRGLDVLGFYHSHPLSAAEPSLTDLSEALYPEHLYLIVGWPNVSTDAEARAFRLGAERFSEVTLTLA